ncbi:hypothetical protein OG372_04120 [Streptomyces sp. NBC_01020]|uniref:hypothetical protein n=1 Tax=Streptomyces sp. NBC_01020 TaxID=2903722 RepID=UPI0038669CAB|nr:hypothetical protein OG372_04120 [Streptomyces sp. NBC_01020]
MCATKCGLDQSARAVVAFRSHLVHPGAGAGPPTGARTAALRCRLVLDVRLSTAGRDVTGPVSPEYLKRHLLHQGVYLERICGDRVLHEALTVGADPLHLALVFNLSHTAASRYAAIAQNLLDDQIEQTAEMRSEGRAGALDGCP